jgi:hypothetical protein
LIGTQAAKVDWYTNQRTEKIWMARMREDLKVWTGKITVTLTRAIKTNQRAKPKSGSSTTLI